MAYEKTVWKNGQSPAINSNNLNKIEKGIEDAHTQMADLAENKVDKVPGKGLSSNDYTTTEKNKLAGIATGAQVNPTAAQILTSLKTVDGTGSGLDADLLDGKHASDFVLATSMKMANGSYIGNDIDNRVITVGFAPKLVFITGTVSYSRAAIYHEDVVYAPAVPNIGDTLAQNNRMTSNGFLVSKTSIADVTTNTNNIKYYWYAFG